MSSIVEPQTARPLPSVSRQVARGLLAALAIVAVLALATSLVTGRQPWTTDRWAQLFGDGQITLAAGVVPSEAPATSSVVTVDPSVLELGTSTRALERAFGSPVTEVAIPSDPSLPAQVEAQDHLYRTPLGSVRFFVQEPSAVGVPLIIVRALDRSVVAATPEARAALVRKVTAGIGFTAGDHVPAEVAVATSEQVSDGHIEVMSRLAVGPDGASPVEATVVEERNENQRVVAFSEPIQPHLRALGETPLPPYITTPLADPDRYQTVFARADGSAAAPTAGLHFTGEMLLNLKRRGVEIAYCTLHIGLDTFSPVRAENVADHIMHTEHAILTPEDAQIVNNARLRGRRVVAIGTTAVRTLETAAIRSAAYGTATNDPASVRRTLANLAENACPWRPVMAIDEDTDLFITLGYHFRVVDRMLTNFHLPRSTLLMLVSAFSGRERILRAYDEAIRERYRFYSLGDCCLLL